MHHIICHTVTACSVMVVNESPLCLCQVQDAQATMRLYTLVKKQWEAEIKAKKSKGSAETNERKPRCPVSKGRKSTGK